MTTLVEKLQINLSAALAAQRESAAEVARLGRELGEAQAELREVRALVGVLAENINEIANFGIPDQSASSAGDDLWWAQKHVARLRGMAEQEAKKLFAISARKALEKTK